jgi:murein DD-endopeptidase MepM/ murein hydrolase activator NlpD
MPSRVEGARQLGRRCRQAAVVLAVVAVAVIAVVYLRAPAPSLGPERAVPATTTAIPPAIPSVPRPTLTVRVLAGGSPFAGAEVWLGDGSGPAAARSRTDHTGIVRFEALAPGAHELWATHEALASRIARIAEVTAEPVELALEPASRVRGQITVDGAIPAGATVQLVPADLDHAIRIAAVDAQGHFAIDGVPRGRWRVEASVTGHVQRAAQILHARDATASLVVAMQRAGAVSGTVVDGSGTPVANATIVLREQGPPAPATQRPFTLASRGVRWVHPLAGSRLLPDNSSGRFGAPRPGPRPAECSRGHCGLDLGRIRGSTVHAAADGEIAAVFAESRTEAGRVVVIDHGGGLRTFYMHLDDIRAGFEIGQPIRAGDPVGTLGSTGFKRSIPHLHFAMTYERGGRSWYLDPEPMIHHAVVLATPRAIDPVDPAALGPVAPPGPPGPPGRTQPVVRSFTTDARGGFRIDGVAPGPHVAAAFATGHAPGASPPFTVTSGGETTGVVVTLRAGAIVAGRVLGRDGPIAGASVVARIGFGETVNKIATTTSDRHGEFTLRSLAGKVTIAVTAPGHGEAERTIALDTGAGSRLPRREEFRLTVQNAHLRGQILAPDGGAAPGVVVRVVAGPTVRRAVTDAQGRFSIDHVASGRYILELASPEHPSKRVVVDSDRWTEHRLEAGGGARCTVRDARSGAPLAGIRVEGNAASGASVSGTTNPRGVVELRGLIAGDWRLTVRAAGYVPATRTLAIPVSRLLQDVSIDLVPGATIAGVVRDRYGRRVAGARVTLGQASVVTDRDGNFRITGATSGILEAEHDGQRGHLSLSLAPGDERLSLTVELGR